jgi:hypothetical protein
MDVCFGENVAFCVQINDDVVELWWKLFQKKNDGDKWRCVEES